MFDLAEVRTRRREMADDAGRRVHTSLGLRHASAGTVDVGDADFRSRSPFRTNGISALIKVNAAHHRFVIHKGVAQYTSFEDNVVTTSYDTVTDG